MFGMLADDGGEKKEKTMKMKTTIGRDRKQSCKNDVAIAQAGIDAFERA
jgi:hypothetical protein